MLYHSYIMANLIITIRIGIIIRVTIILIIIIIIGITIILRIMGMLGICSPSTSSSSSSPTSPLSSSSKLSGLKPRRCFRAWLSVARAISAEGPAEQRDGCSSRD